MGGEGEEEEADLGEEDEGGGVEAWREEGGWGCEVRVRDDSLIRGGGGGTGGVWLRLRLRGYEWGRDWGWWDGVMAAGLLCYRYIRAVR